MGGRLNFRWVSFSVRKFIWKTYFTPRRVFTLQSWQILAGILRASDRVPHAFNTRANVVAVLRAVYEPNLRFICFVIYYRWPALFSLLLFESIRVIVENEKHDKKKGKEWRLKNLAESIPELIPRPLILTRGFVFIIFCSVGIGKAENISFFFFPYISSIYIYCT